MKVPIHKLIILTVLLFSNAAFVSAQTPREEGIRLYKEGEDQAAISALEKAFEKNKEDSEVLNYLGLAYLNTGNNKDALKALQKAVKAAPENVTIRVNLAYANLLSGKINSSQREIEKAIRLDPNNANAFYIRGLSYLKEDKYDECIADADRAIGLDGDFTEAYILKSDALMHRFGRGWGKTDESLEWSYLLEDAEAVLKSCQGNCLLGRGAGKIRERLDGLAALNKYFQQEKNNSEDQPGERSDNGTPINFLAKYPPRYTDSARRAGEEGLVTLAVLFGADAKIKYIIVLKGLNHGLTEQAIAAARRIQFEPATRNGKPVPVVKKVSFTFSIY